MIRVHPRGRVSSRWPLAPIMRRGGAWRAAYPGGRASPAGGPDLPRTGSGAASLLSNISNKIWKFLAGQDSPWYVAGSLVDPSACAEEAATAVPLEGTAFLGRNAVRAPDVGSGAAAKKMIAVAL